MNISVFFEPIELPNIQPAFSQQKARLIDIIQSFNENSGFPDLEKVDIAIIGVTEDRNSISNEGCKDAPEHVRKYLYSLFQGPNKPRIADLGNVKNGHSVSDTYFAVSQIISELISNNVLPIIIGGSQDITYANYLAYEKLGQIVNIVSVDSSFDLGTIESDIDAKSYLSKIILHEPNYLFNYANIGYQTYFVDQEAIRLMKNLYFDAYRLGVVRSNMEEVEPVVRNADILSFDISAIRQSDAPGNQNASPNGFYGEECCQITRYAGMSDKLSSIGFYEFNPKFDNNGQTAQLVAQMIWYFIEGYYNRKGDFPFKNKEDYKKFYVPIENHDNELEFVKSKNSDRWWMKVPCKSSEKAKYERHYMVPCSYSDYLKANDHDIPDKWWQVYQKLM